MPRARRLVGKKLAAIRVRTVAGKIVPDGEDQPEGKPAGGCCLPRKQQPGDRNDACPGHDLPLALETVCNVSKQQGRHRIGQRNQRGVDQAFNDCNAACFKQGGKPVAEAIVGGGPGAAGYDQHQGSGEQGSAKKRGVAVLEGHGIPGYLRTVGSSKGAAACVR